MRVLIYGRVSTFSQDVDRQIEELVSLCNSRNYELVKVFTETVSGVANRKKRKEISQLIEFIKSTENINGVLVYELSRLGRRTEDVLDIIKELTSRKIWVYSKKDDLFTLNQDGTENTSSKLTLTILSAVAELERKTILIRSASGMKSSVNNGNWLGGKFLPYGYKREMKKLVIDEEESEIVKLIFQLYLKGDGTHKIAKTLNNKGIPTRYNKTVTKPIIINSIEKKGEDFTWKDGTVYSILTNPTYIGKREGKGLIKGLKLNSPPIIDENDFYAVREKLKTATKKTSTKFFYLFDKKLQCGVCGRSYHPHKRADNKDNRYVCLSRRYNESCENYGISIPKLHDAVWSLLRHNPREIERILAENNSSENIEKEIQQLEEAKNSLLSTIERIDRQEKQLVDLLLEDKIDRIIYDEKHAIIKKEKIKAKEELDSCLGELSLKRNQRDKQNNAGFQLRGIKDNKAVLKRVINNVVNRIKLYPINQHNLSKAIKVNQQDKFLFVEVFTYLNSNTPLCFIISQRSEQIIIPNQNEYEKTTKSLEIGKERTNFVEEEEEEEEIVVRKIYHLQSLD
jgi:site-specific DNA recombinase